MTFFKKRPFINVLYFLSKHKKKTFLLGLIVLGMLFLWGHLNKKPEDLRASQETKDHETLGPLVSVYRSHPKVFTPVFHFQALTQGDHTLMIRSEVDGIIKDIHRQEGDTFEKGDTLVTLEEEDRPERLAYAKALLAQRHMEYLAAQKLAEKAFRSQVRLAEARSHLRSAESGLARIQQELKDTIIKAPFKGVLEERFPVVGERVQKGSILAQFQSLNPLKAVAHVSSTHIQHLKKGMKAIVCFDSFPCREGHITFVGSQGDEKTRTFRVEVAIPGDQGIIPLNMSCHLQIYGKETVGHAISISHMALDDQGVLGVKAVNPQNKGVFIPLESVYGDEKHVWITTQPGPLDIITHGGESVSEGTKVRVKRDTSPKKGTAP